MKKSGRESQEQKSFEAGKGQSPAARSRNFLNRVLKAVAANFLPPVAGWSGTALSSYELYAANFLPTAAANFQATAAA